MCRYTEEAEAAAFAAAAAAAAAEKGVNGVRGGYVTAGGSAANARSAAVVGGCTS